MNINKMKKLLATIIPVLLVTTMLYGSITPTTVAANITVDLSPWSFYQTGTSTNQYAANEVCAFSKVTNSEGEVFEGQEDFPYGVWSDTENKYVGGNTQIGTDTTKTFTKSTDNFTASIVSNGWSYDFENDKNNPYTLSASSNMNLVKGRECEISFDASIEEGASNNGNLTSRKYMHINILDEHSDDVCLDETFYITTEEDKFEYLFYPQNTSEYRVTLEFGAFPCTDDVVDIIEKEWSGTINMSNIVVEMELPGILPETTTTSKEETTTVNVDSTTKNIESTSTEQQTSKNIKDIKASIKSAKNIKGKKVLLKIKKLKNVSGYQIQYSTNKKFSKANSKYTTKLSYTVKKLKKNKKYYFRARAYKTVSGKKKYGKWSSVKKVKVNK